MLVNYTEKRIYLTGSSHNCLLHDGNYILAQCYLNHFLTNKNAHYIVIIQPLNLLLNQKILKADLDYSFIVSKDFKIRYVSASYLKDSKKSFLEVVNLTFDSVVGKTLFDQYFKSEITQCSEDESSQFETWIKIDADNDRYMQSCCQPISSYKLADCVLVVMRDMTEAELARQQLMNMKRMVDEANHAKSDFLSSMSHELKTPMNAILGFAQILDFDHTEPLTIRQKGCVDNILNAGKHLLSLIDDVLDLSRIESGQIEIMTEDFDPEEAIHESVGLLSNMADKYQVNLSLMKTSSNIMPIHADTVRFRQVLLNLLTNAIKYNRPQGEVSLSCQECSEMMRFLIKDNGEGISPEQQHLLFEPFNRLGKEASSIEGTGIGLTLTKQLIEMMHGHIGFESELNQGSTFWVELPYAIGNVNQDSVEKQVDNHQKQLQQLNKPSIIFIEDNPANITLVKMILEHYFPDFDLVAVHTAELGLEMVDLKRPSLILVDIDMNGLHDFSVLSQLKSKQNMSEIPIIAVGENKIPRNIEEKLAAGFQFYITKPLQIGQMIDTFNSILTK